MRRISAHYIFTSSGKPLKSGVVTLSDDNTVVSVEESTAGETASTEFYNGIITPGFVNCHCHLELSHLHNSIPAGKGLAEFITMVRESREMKPEDIVSSAIKADQELFSEGTVVCGDISNNEITFSIKSQSAIAYTTFIEVFGIDTGKAQRRVDRAMEVAAAAAAAGLRYHITPHSVYSVSQTLMTRLRHLVSPASITSLHFLETSDERELASRRRGRLMDSYRALGITKENIDTPTDLLQTALSLAAATGTLILVHNTCIEKAEAETLAAAGNTWFCLCPSSNIYISGEMPPLKMLRETTDRIVMGTDSLASNNRLSILHELRILNDTDPSLTLDLIIQWATINGAKALCMDETFGSIEPGKRPGLLLIEGADLPRLRLTPESRVKRLL